MSTKESNLTTITASDLSASDKVRVLDNESSRNITVQNLCEAQQSIFEGLGFVTTSSTPSNFTQTRKVVTKVTNYTLTVADSVILCSSGSGAFAINLPAASVVWSAGNTSSQQFTVKRITGDSNSITVTPPGSELIDGASDYVLAGPGRTTVTFLSDGTNWYTV